MRDDENDILARGVERVFLIGFHAGAGAPLRYAHTFTYAIKSFRIGNRDVGETTMWAHSAGSIGIPVALLCGDSYALAEMKQLGTETVCVETKEQKPELVRPQIREAAKKAVTQSIRPVASQKPFSVRIAFRSAKVSKIIPDEYVTRREAAYLIIENEDAHKVYGDLRKLLCFLRERSLGYRVMSIFER